MEGSQRSPWQGEERHPAERRLWEVESKIVHGLPEGAIIAA